MLGKYIDIGNPISDHDDNIGQIMWLPGFSPYTRGPKWFDITKLTAGGTLNNSPPWRRVGKKSGITFNGTSHYVSTPDISYSGGLTVAATIRYDSDTGAYRPLIVKWNEVANRSWGLAQSSGTVRWLDTSDGNYSAGRDITDTTALSVGRAYRIVVSYDNNAGAKIYKDGVQVASHSNTGTLFTTTATPRIGGIETGYQFGGVGNIYSACGISDIIIYGKPVSLSWIARDYQQSLNYPEYDSRLRTYSRKTYYFGAYSAAGGGPITENASPIVATASVVTPSTTLAQTGTPITVTATVVAPTDTLSQSESPITTTGTVITPTTSLNQSRTPITSTGSVVNPTTSLNHTFAPVTVTSTVNFSPRADIPPNSWDFRVTAPTGWEGLSGTWRLTTDGNDPPTWAQTIGSGTWTISQVFESPDYLWMLRGEYNGETVRFSFLGLVGQDDRLDYSGSITFDFYDSTIAWASPSTITTLTAPFTSLTYTPNPIVTTGSVVTSSTGGDIIESPSPVVTTGSVVTPSITIPTSVQPISSTGTVVTPSTALTNAATPITITSLVTTPTPALTQLPQPITTTTSVVTPTDQRSTDATPIVGTTSVVTFATALENTINPIVVTSSVVTPITQVGTVSPPGGTTIIGTVYISGVVSGWIHTAGGQDGSVS